MSSFSVMFSALLATAVRPFGVASGAVSRNNGSNSPKPRLDTNGDSFYGTNKTSIYGWYLSKSTRFFFAPCVTNNVSVVSIEGEIHSLVEFSTDSEWRGGIPGPIRIIGFDNGGGFVPVDVNAGNLQKSGSILPIIFESTTKMYAHDPYLHIRGDNMRSITEFYFADYDLRLGVNYTVESANESVATLKLLSGSWLPPKGLYTSRSTWRGILKVLAVKEGDTVIFPVSKKGIQVAHVFLDPVIEASTLPTFPSETMTFRGFLGIFQNITFDPPGTECSNLKSSGDGELHYFTCRRFFSPSLGPLIVKSVDSGAGPKRLMLQVATIVSDDARIRLAAPGYPEELYAPGIPQILYESSTETEIVIGGAGFPAALKAFGNLFFEFEPPIQTTLLEIHERGVTLRVDSEPGIAGDLRLVKVFGGAPSPRGTRVNVPLETEDILSGRSDGRRDASGTVVATIQKNPNISGPVYIYDTLSRSSYVKPLIDNLLFGEEIYRATFDPPDFPVRWIKGYHSFILDEPIATSWGNIGDVKIVALATSHGLVKFSPPQIIARVQSDDQARVCPQGWVEPVYDEYYGCRVNNSKKVKHT